MSGKMLGTVIEDFPHGSIGAPHHSFHSINRAEEMGFVDSFGSACPDKNVLVISGHPDYFVRHDLPDGENQIMRSVGKQSVDLNGNAVIDFSLGHFFDECSRHFTQRGQALSPVMNTKQALRHFAEHGPDFFIGHRVMSADGGQNISQPLPVIFPRHFCQEARLRMIAREIRRNRKHAFFFSQPIKSGKESFPNFLGRKRHIG